MSCVASLKLEFQRLREGEPILFAEDACLIVRRPALSCRLCKEACPVGAISGNQWSVALAGDDCVACGLCAAACPTGALAVEPSVMDAPSAPDATSGRQLDCRRVPAALRDQNATVVPCLGGLTVPDLIELVAASAGPVTIKDRGWCNECGVAKHPEPWRANLDEAKSILAAIDPALADQLDVEQSPLLQQRAGPIMSSLRPDRRVARRDFLRRLLGSVSAHGPAESRRIVFGRGLVRPFRRERILAVVSVLAARRHASVPAALTPKVKIADGCELHGVCAAICPTGALRKVDARNNAMESEIRIEFDGALCIACGECQHACPGKALSLWNHGDGLTAAAPVTLASRRSATCGRCGAQFTVLDEVPNGDGACFACRRSADMMRDLGRFRSQYNTGN